MEARQANLHGGYMKHTMSAGLRNQLVEGPASAIPISAPMFESYPGITSAFSQNMIHDNPHVLHLQDSARLLGAGCDPRVQVPVPAGVSNCYVFKSRLQEYAQKVGLSTPVYETIREGPSHEPSFRSTVIVGGVRYESLLGFTNRKAAEQSAAEVALIELSKSGEKKESISAPVHETGLCKNLLQEYAQKMNYAIPTYSCQKNDTQGRMPFYLCTVDIGGIQYIGAAARTKKEAEIKAARTALLAIQSSGRIGGELVGRAELTVVPCKRKMPETAPPQASTKKAKKTRKRRCKKKPHKQVHPGVMGIQSEAGNITVLAKDAGTDVSDQQHQEIISDVQVADSRQIPHGLGSLVQVNEAVNVNQPNGQASTGEGCVDPEVNLKIGGCQLTASDCQEGSVNIGSSESALPFTPKAPTSVQLDALLPVSVINLGREAGNIMVLASNMGTAASDQQQEGLSDVRVPDSGQVPHTLDTSLQVNESADANQPNGQASAGECCGGPKVILNTDVGQLTASNSEEGNANIGSSEFAVPDTNACSSGVMSTITTEVNAPTLVQLDVLHPDSASNQARELAAVTHSDHVGNEKDGHGGDDNVSDHLDVLRPDSETGTTGGHA